MLTGVLVSVVLAAANPATRTPDLRQCVDKGLKWLAANQAKDGSWAVNGNFLRTQATAYAGVALLMEGSTLRHGAYSDNLRRAVGWFENVAQPNGLLVPADDPGERGRTMQSHAPALLFLACAYDVDDDEPRRERLRKLLAAAVLYAADGQTRRGGWGLVAARDGGDYDEFNQTTAMLHALFAADRAGIEVSRGTIQRALRHLADGTDRNGGIIFSIAGGVVPDSGGGQPYPTAAAAAALLTSEHRPPLLAKWVGFSTRYITVPAAPKSPAVAQTDSYTLLQLLTLGRVANALGDDGHRRLDPAAGAPLRWSAYRTRLSAYVAGTQKPDGRWTDLYLGDAYTTSIALTILQLDNNYLPAFSR